MASGADFQRQAGSPALALCSSSSAERAPLAHAPASAASSPRATPAAAAPDQRNRRERAGSAKAQPASCRRRQRRRAAAGAAGRGAGLLLRTLACCSPPLQIAGLVSRRRLWCVRWIAEAIAAEWSVSQLCAKRRPVTSFSTETRPVCEEHMHHMHCRTMLAIAVDLCVICCLVRAHVLRVHARTTHAPLPADDERSCAISQEIKRVRTQPTQMP